MRYFVQYHSFEKLGRYPGSPNHYISITSTHKLPLLKETLNNMIFLIVGKKINGEMRYYLWSKTIIEYISQEDSDGQYHANGQQIVFDPKRRIDKEKGWDHFFHHWGHGSIGLIEITSNKFLKTLVEKANT